MERRLSIFIPLVRFYFIFSEDFLLKIYPFKFSYLPNELINNIAFHMVPNNKLNINTQLPRCIGSKIINFRHFNIFASWINKKETLHYNKVGHIPYKFKLLYRTSKDGNTAAAFHKRCDNKATIVIAKITNSEQIIEDIIHFNGISFIISFKNRTNFQSAKVGYKNNQDNHSVYCS